MRVMVGRRRCPRAPQHAPFGPDLVKDIAVNVARRRVLQLGGTVAAALALGRTARAADYPTRPVRILVGFAASVAMLLDAVAKASPDGYTLLMAGNPNA